MTTIDERKITDKNGQEIVVSVIVTEKLTISFQRTGIDSDAISVSATITESGVRFDKGFPVDVSESEQHAIIKATTDMLVRNVFGKEDQ